MNRVFLGAGEAAFDFFEFGVYRGDSLRTWCALNGNRDTRFFGFDSFRGLPAHWKPSRPEGGV